MVGQIERKILYIYPTERTAKRQAGYGVHYLNTQDDPGQIRGTGLHNKK